MYKLYKNLVIKDPDEPPTKTEIQLIESAIEAKLPHDFLDFITIANGGTMEYFGFDLVLDSYSETLEFNRIFSIKPSVNGNFLSQIKRHRSDLNVPNKILPIAQGPDVYLYLDLRQPDKCYVLARIHDCPDALELPQAWQDFDPIIKIADSFTEYLEALQFDSHFWKVHLEKLIAQKQTQYISATIEYLDLALPNWREVFDMDYDSKNS